MATRYLYELTLTLLLLCSSPIFGQDETAETPASEDQQPGNPGNHKPERWNVHFQITSIVQHHGSFYSKYEGENSLPAHAENRVSITATVFMTVRLNSNLDVILNPEIAGGKGFGDVTGIAGFTNGEMPRVQTATPKLYLARGYLRGSWALGDGTKFVEDGPNQLAGQQPIRRLTVLVGKFAVTDYFDCNTYSHDPRTQFMNWSLMYNGAWDYPADVRGYTIGVMQELTMRRWSVRTAMVMEPTTANGPTLDTRMTKNRGQLAEGELRFTTKGNPGKLRVLGFLHREDAGTFREALSIGGNPPDLGPTRRSGTHKYGTALNLEQSLAEGIGLFSRYGWSDGKTETWAFTQIDRSISGGVSINGRFWKRPADHIGVAAVRNYLSGDQRSFLSAGGVGFIIGDGRLTYGPESIVEAYYAWRAVKGWTITGDYQHIQNPAYNRDRGPVDAISIRLHWEK
ncbi:MAG TPA: carbohydrate porin [Acidobacteriota bacterium]|nr:carbohydrate porin [Acidobacteriota bacterium]